MQSQYLLFHPRAYNRRGTEDRHSIFGVTTEGDELSVKLRSQDGSALPITVNDLAQVGLDAKSPCMASPDNGPGHSQKGLLLFTDITLETDGSVIAHSVHVIRSGIEPILPVRGIGRLCINENTRAVLTAKNLLQRCENEQETQRLTGIVNDPSHYQYSAIVYQVEKSTLIDLKEGWTDIALDAVGHWGSKRLLVKVFSPSKGVKYIDEVEIDDPVIPIKDQWRAYFQNLSFECKVGEQMLLMQFERYECSKEASKFYAQAYPWLKELYYQAENEVLTEVILSLVESPTSDELFLKMLFPLTKKIGMLKNLNVGGKFDFGVRTSNTLPKAFRQGLNYQLKAGKDYWKRKNTQEESIDLQKEDIDYQKEHYHEFQYISDEDPFGDTVSCVAEIEEDTVGETSTQDLTSKSHKTNIQDNDGDEDSKIPGSASSVGSRGGLGEGMTGLAAFIAKRIG